VWPWYLHPGEAYDEEFVTKAALMQGIKGFSRYMLVERDRWLDSPIRRDGRIRDKAEMFADANQMQADGRFTSLRRESNVLLLANREYDRLEAASVLVSFPGDFLETPSTFSEYPNRMTVAEETLGFSRPIQVEKSAWFTAFYDALYTTGYDYVLSDTALSPARWADYRALVVSTFEYLNAGTQSALVEYARAGGVLVIGPDIPELDSQMAPCTTLADALSGEATSVGSGRSVQVGAGQVLVVSDLAQVSAALRSAFNTTNLSRITKSDEALDVVVHRDTTDPTRRVVFVCNPTDADISTRVGLGVEVLTAADLWADDAIPVKEGELALDLPPYSITVADLTVRV
jgi:beta-galactosidase